MSDQCSMKDYRLAMVAVTTHHRLPHTHVQITQKQNTGVCDLTVKGQVIIKVALFSGCEELEGKESNQHLCV